MLKAPRSNAATITSGVSFESMKPHAMRAEDVPLFADAKIVAFLRDRYRRKYLKDVVPDLPNGETPGGNWYELVGSSYDRTTYGFEIETSTERSRCPQLVRRLARRTCSSVIKFVYLESDANRHYCTRDDREIPCFCIL